jgi:hypothetical protein
MDPLKATLPASFFLQSAVASPRLEAKVSVAGETGGDQKPILSPEILQYFMPLVGTKPDGSSLVYHPMILGAAQIRFTDTRIRIDVSKDAVFVASITNDPVPVNWDNSTEADLKLTDLRNASSEDAQYAELPSAASNAKNYSLWQKDFANWLLRSQKLELFKSPSLKEFSRPREAERDFRVRLQHAARELRDQYADKLRVRYASNVAGLDQRIRSAQMTLERQKARISEQKYESAASFGATLLSSFLGRKSTSSAARTARGIGRTMKESKVKKITEENLKTLQQQRAQLESQFQSEIAMLETKINPLTENLENISIIPSRANILTKLVALVWTPHWLDVQGKATPTWQ